MQTSSSLLRRSFRSAAQRPSCPCCSISFSTSASSGRAPVPIAFDDFKAADNELRRRKRKADAKRRQHGSSFLDHLIVSVRGGTGGSGAAAFVPMKSSSIGPPSGGNGGQGGSVYFTTSPDLTSLVSVGKRLRGGKGLNGLGSYQHGKRGGDLIVELPVGTVVKEMSRVEDGVAAAGEEDDAGFSGSGSGYLDQEEEDRIRREKLFIKHPTADISEDDYRNAERHLAREGRTHSSSQSGLLPGPIDLDISTSLERPILISPGGQGGLGNPHFYTEHGRPPRLASRGLTPATITLSLELKLLADVGLVGFPNAGKSTILRALTGRKAEVAGYQFTTLNPQVGVVRVADEEGNWKGGMEEGDVVEETWRERELEREAREDEEYWAPAKHEERAGKDSPSAEPRSRTVAKRLLKRTELIRFTISDNPGLLPLASENYGLGHSFLRSIERSLALAYVLDLTRPEPEQDMRALAKELEAYKEGLSEKVGLVIMNKADGVEDDVAAEKTRRVREALDELEFVGERDPQDVARIEVVTVSARHTQGLKQVVRVLAKRVREARKRELPLFPVDRPIGPISPATTSIDVARPDGRVGVEAVGEGEEEQEEVEPVETLVRM